MKDWLQRHFLLTREEQWLTAGILLILLLGIGARIVLRDEGPLPSEPPHPAETTTGSGIR